MMHDFDDDTAVHVLHQHSEFGKLRMVWFWIAYVGRHGWKLEALSLVNTLGAVPLSGAYTHLAYITSKRSNRCTNPPELSIFHHHGRFDKYPTTSNHVPNGQTVQSGLGFW